VTRTRKRKFVTGIVGIPVICPVADFNVRPLGNAAPSFRVQVNGATPPLAWRVWTYGTPTCPLGRDSVVIDRVYDKMLKTRATVAVCVGELESVTWNITELASGSVGVPAITPVMPFSANPSGSLPEITVQVYGPRPPAAARVWE
jgi:hypothetical protein